MNARRILPADESGVTAIACTSIAAAISFAFTAAVNRTGTKLYPRFASINRSLK